MAEACNCCSALTECTCNRGVDRGGGAGSGELLPRAVGGVVTASAEFQDEGSEKGDQEAGNQNAGEETASVGDDQGGKWGVRGGIAWIGLASSY